jgi:hypothetical protein
MILLAPLFLLGLAGLALPWWLHRLEMQNTDREMFATTRFLEASKKRIHVQRKLRYLLLMVLRMAFLALLAIAFARPLLFNAPDAVVTTDSIHHVIVVDTSFSMKEGTKLAAAKARVQTIVAGMGDDDLVSLYTASTNVATVVEPTNASDAVTEALDTMATDNGQMNLGVMVDSLNSLIEDSPAPVTLHVVSDMQLSSQAVRFADMVPNVVQGRPVQLDLQSLSNTPAANYTVESVLIENRTKVMATVRTYSGELAAAGKQLSLSINGTAQQNLPVPAGSNGVAQVVFDNVVFGEGDNKVDVALTPNDSLAADDVRYTVFDNSPPAPVLMLTSDPVSLAVTYLSAALATAPRGYALEVNNLADFDARVLQRYPWLIVDDLGAINASLAAALTDYINGGGSVFAALGAQANQQTTLPILNVAATASVLGNAAAPAAIAQIDISHPVLNNSGGWANVNVHAVKVVPSDNDRVLIAQEGAVPVLLERNIGAGRLLLFTSSLDNSASDLPVKPVFVSFMAEVAQYLSNEKLLVKAQTADSYLQLSQTGGASGQVVDPTGKNLLSLQDTTQAQEVLLNLTGYYQVFTPAGEVLVAVNPDGRESDLTMMSSETLQNWQASVSGASVGGGTVATDMALAQTEKSDAEEIEIWRVFLLLMALMVLAESLLSARYLNTKTGTF